MKRIFEKVVVVGLLSLFGGLMAPSAQASFDYIVEVDDHFLAWDINEEGDLEDLDFYTTLVDAQEDSNDVKGDGYDGIGPDGEDAFDAAEGRSLALADVEDDGSWSWTYSAQSINFVTAISGNRIWWVINNKGSENYAMPYNVGSDEDTLWYQGERYLISYGDSSDPVHAWKYSDGELVTEDSEDSDVFNVAAGSCGVIAIRSFVYSSNWDDDAGWLEKFESWISENPERGDEFDFDTYAESGTVQDDSLPSCDTYFAAPAALKIKITPMKDYGDSFDGSDLLFDPTGELRRLIDEIMKS